MANDDALEMVRMRNNFYRDNYRRVVMAVLILLVVNAIAVSTLAYYVVFHRPRPQYFATTATGRIMPLYPLNAPMYSQASLLQWANQAVVSIFNFDFVHWRRQFQEAAEYFTPDGWTNYEAAIQASGNLKTVIAKKLTVTAVATGAPVITQQGVIGGRYSWKVQMPLLVTYQSTTQTITQSITVELLITRVPVLNQPRGIAIAQFISSQGAIGPQFQQQAGG